MANRMTINYEKKPCYDIVFTSSFDLLAEELQALGIADRRVAVIADSCTKKLFGDAVCGQLGQEVIGPGQLVQHILETAHRLGQHIPLQADRLLQRASQAVGKGVSAAGLLEAPDQNLIGSVQKQDLIGLLVSLQSFHGGKERFEEFSTPCIGHHRHAVAQPF